MASVTIFNDACKGVEDCGICISVCPKDLIIESGEMNTAGYFPPKMHDEENCIHCQNCMIYCPDFAIVVEKEEDGQGAREVSHD